MKDSEKHNAALKQVREAIVASIKAHIKRIQDLIEAEDDENELEGLMALPTTPFYAAINDQESEVIDGIYTDGKNVHIDDCDTGYKVGIEELSDEKLIEILEDLEIIQKAEDAEYL